MGTAPRVRAPKPSRCPSGPWAMAPFPGMEPRSQVWNPSRSRDARPCQGWDPGPHGARRRPATCTPLPGSPTARYRFSTPVLASSAPSASVATFFCSRKRSKRWRRPSMAAAGAGQPAQAHPQPRAPAAPRAHGPDRPRTARPRPRPAAFSPPPWLRPRLPALANGRARRTKEVGPAPSPPPHGPLARVEAGGASRRPEGAGRQASGALIGQEGVARY